MPEIAADELVMILRLHAVHAQDVRALEKRRVLRHQRARIAERAEILRREKTGHAEIAERAHRPAAIVRAERLRRVLDHAQVVLRGEREDRVHVGGLAEEMHRDDRARPRGDAPRRVAHVEVEGGRRASRRAPASRRRARRSRPWRKR